MAERCPKCDHRSVAHSYGLGGGGFGAMSFCTRKVCGWFFKQQECPVCEALLSPEGDCPDCGTPEQIQAALKKRYPPQCRACGRPIGPRQPDGSCALICRDGLPCGGILPQESQCP